MSQEFPTVSLNITRPGKKKKKLKKKKKHTDTVLFTGQLARGSYFPVTPDGCSQTSSSSWLAGSHPLSYKLRKKLRRSVVISFVVKPSPRSLRCGRSLQNQGLSVSVSVASVQLYLWTAVVHRLLVLLQTYFLLNK